jgi:ABC-2 type transport system ATP-binding protein
MMWMIETRNLGKRFFTAQALEDVTLQVAQGKIVGLLGRNGAGKTTLLNILANRMQATAGQALLFGEPVWENAAVQSRLYFMADQKLIPSSMRLRDVIAWTSQFYSSFDREYAAQLAVKFGLDTAKNVRSLSTGQSSCFKLTLALSSGVDLLLLDEPVLGLDANHRTLFYRELIARMEAHPATCIVSTHLIDEVADVIEDAIILHHGRVLIQDSVENLRQGAYAVSGAAQAMERFLQGKPVLDTQALGGLRTAAVGAPADDASRRQAAELGLEISPVSLQSLFVSMTAQ